MNRTFPISEVAQRLIGVAMDAAYKEHHAFYEARYNSAETLVSDSIQSEKDIQDLLYVAFAEAAILMLGSECVCPYASFVTDEMLQYARSEIPPFRKMHEDVEEYVSARWSGNVDSTYKVFGIVADWLCEKLLKEPNGIAAGTFCAHFSEMKIQAISLIGDYFDDEEVTAEEG